MRLLRMIGANLFATVVPGKGVLIGQLCRRRIDLRLMIG